MQIPRVEIDGEQQWDVGSYRKLRLKERWTTNPKGIIVDRILINGARCEHRDGRCYLIGEPPERL